MASGVTFEPRLPTNGIVYLLDDEGPCEHPLYARAQLMEVVNGDP
jgi:hypothetical protein